MIKYLGYAVTFQEIPDEITLCFNITNCPYHCVGCHSPDLQKDIGDALEKDIRSIVDRYINGITCVCFMGEGNDIDALEKCMLIISQYYPELKIALYTGMDYVIDNLWDMFDDNGKIIMSHDVQLSALIEYGRTYEDLEKDYHFATIHPLINYVKLGHYDQNLGGLSCQQTNQRLFEISEADSTGMFCETDITSKFWKRRTNHYGNQTTEGSIASD